MLDCLGASALSHLDHKGQARSGDSKSLMGKPLTAEKFKTESSSLKQKDLIIDLKTEKRKLKKRK